MWPARRIQQDNSADDDDYESDAEEYILPDELPKKKNSCLKQH